MAGFGRQIQVGLAGIRRLFFLYLEKAVHFGVDWMKFLTVGEIAAGQLEKLDLAEEGPSCASALIKNEQDYEMLMRHGIE